MNNGIVFLVSVNLMQQTEWEAIVKSGRERLSPSFKATRQHHLQNGACKHSSWETWNAFWSSFQQSIRASLWGPRAFRQR